LGRTDSSSKHAAAVAAIGCGERFDRAQMEQQVECRPRRLVGPAHGAPKICFA